MILGLSFGVYPNPLALKIAPGEREPFIGEGKRFEMKSAGLICGTQQQCLKLWLYISRAKVSSSAKSITLSSHFFMVQFKFCNDLNRFSAGC